PDWGTGIDIRVLPAEAGEVAHAFPPRFGKAMYRAALAEDAWAYHAHDLNTALVALAAAAQKRVPCVCDFHEWFSENVYFDTWAAPSPPRAVGRRWAFGRLEARAFFSAGVGVPVGNTTGLRREKHSRPPQKVHVVRNIPFFEDRVKEP